LRLFEVNRTAGAFCADEAAEAVAVEGRPIELFWFFEATAEDRAGETARVVASLRVATLE
jgi:hypothetical protein